MAEADNGKGDEDESLVVYPKSKPRKPRNRAVKRHIAEPGLRSAPRDVEAFKFPVKDAMDRKQLEDLEAMLGECASPAFNLRERLEIIARQHLHWRGQPPPSKSEARYQIEMLAWLAGQIQSKRSGDAKAHQKFLETLDDLNDRARAALWQEIGEHADWPQIEKQAENPAQFSPMEYLKSDALDVGFIGRSAASLASRLKTRGDYSDMDLALSVSELVKLYEDCTGDRATWSVWRERGGIIKRDEHSAVSQCTRFVVQFFAIVEPGTGPSKPVNALKRFLAWRSKAAGNSPT